MAVSNAIGTWMHEYPMTPQRVLKAVKKADSNGLDRVSGSSGLNVRDMGGRK